MKSFDFSIKQKKIQIPFDAKKYWRIGISYEKKLDPLYPIKIHILYIWLYKKYKAYVYKENYLGKKI